MLSPPAALTKTAMSMNGFKGTSGTALAPLSQWLVDLLPKESEEVQQAAPKVGVANDAAAVKKALPLQASGVAIRREATDYGERALQDELSILRGAREGKRNHQLNKSSFAMAQLAAGGYLDTADTKSQLVAAAIAIGLNEQEIDRTIASAWQAGVQSPRKQVPLARDDRKKVSQTIRDNSALPLVWFHDIKPNLDHLWLVDGVIPRVGLALIYGHPGTAKTFFAIDMACHIAMGWDWQGNKVEHGLVIYVGAEGQSGLNNRISAFRQHHEVEKATPFALVPCPIDMQGADADTPRLVELIKHASEESGHDPRLIVIDTISKTLGAGKENTDDMAAYVANCQSVASHFDCCVMPVHHRPKTGGDKSPRGHSSLSGGVDTILLVEGDKIRKATVTKQKDGEDGKTYTYGLTTIELGLDKNGKPVTSCVVNSAAIDTSLPADPKRIARKNLSPLQSIALEELGKSLEFQGVFVPNDIPDDRINKRMIRKVVRSDIWADMFSAVINDNPDTPDKKPNTVQKSFKRSRATLINKGLVGTWNGWAWIN